MKTSNLSKRTESQIAKKGVKSRTRRSADKMDIVELKNRCIQAVDQNSDFGPSWVHNSYKELVKYFESVSSEKPLTAHHFFIGAYFSYGWMPTMLRVTGCIDDALKAVNKARASKQSISEAEFMTIASVINGSVVGASKLLHFICPDKYAIWDSRVYRFIFQREPYQYRLEAPLIYQEYLDTLKKITSDSEFSRVKILVEKSIGYVVTDLRACELIMFSNGKAPDH
jgi:hypothetical protein